MSFTRMTICHGVVACCVGFLIWVTPLGLMADEDTAEGDDAAIGGAQQDELSERERLIEALQELPAGIMDVIDPDSEDLETRVAKERELRERSREILAQMTQLQDGDAPRKASKELRPGTVAHGGGRLTLEDHAEQQRLQREERLRKRFEQLDQRGRGYFTLEDKLALPHPRQGADDELSEDVLAAWRQARKDLSPVIIELLDQDSDGMITWDEFSVVPDYRQRAADILHFRSIDADGNGVITPEEWHDFHVERAKVRAAMAGEPAADSYDFRQSFQRFDGDGKGEISEETFVSVLSERRQRASRNQRQRDAAPTQ